MAQNIRLLGIGTRVLFLNTNNTGVITDKLGDGLVMVRLDDDDAEIPVFEEDVERYDPTASAAKTASTLQKKNTARSNTFILRHTGVHLLFEPVETASGLSHYAVFLQNDTLNEISFGTDLILNGKISAKFDGTLSVACLQEVFNLPVHALNDAPEIDVQIFLTYTDGSIEELNKTVKLKAKSFFKTPVFSEALETSVIAFNVFEKLSAQPPAKSDLEKYTAHLLKEKTKREAAQKKLNTAIEPVNINTYASFEKEIDLHIEMLHDDPRALSNAEIVRIQVAAFENYLEKAIHIGVPRVFVIHGLGTGRLKELIAARLRRNPDVSHFKNEYHARYGFGATEIIF